ncbi:UDP-N-acetylglucosamine 2-epimerase (non-hydrolyzing) [Candidatus Sumerlaeota bacterium]|nr:UDP-N-acetylglucosamine 2-epimerase (non-hydrolyzing) [Candidatus Sumerlaeota bacterium]
MKLAFVFGTRPEAIKLAPLIAEAQRRHDRLSSLLISTGQHREMLGSILHLFDIRPHVDLQLMEPGQALADLNARTLTTITRTLHDHPVNVVIVQGDTTTAMAAAVAAFYARIPVAHVEAGLRTDRLDAPFPEEFNRRVIGQVARWHFAPTERARAALLRDGIAATGAQIHVTGNTGIDALHAALRKLEKQRPENDTVRDAMKWKSHKGRPVILITGHRRENFGRPFEQFCAALRDIASAHPDALLVYPVHLNPNVQEPVYRMLNGLENIRLAPVLDYPAFVQMMALSDFIITDSGGVQEEAPALGKPVIVVRDVTERPEAVEAGGVILTGANRARIVAEAGRLLSDQDHYAAMAQVRTPYGDGSASPRIMEILERDLQ